MARNGKVTGIGLHPLRGFMPTREFVLSDTVPGTLPAPAVAVSLSQLPFAIGAHNVRQEQPEARRSSRLGTGKLRPS